jgi:hypothetical protein
MESQLLKFLISAQNSDGGWGYFPGKHSALEPTAYALMALRQKPGIDGVLGKSRQFITVSQSRHGGWPVRGKEIDGASWVTPLVGLAVLAANGETKQTQIAVEFVLSTFGTMPRSWSNRLAEWLGNSTSNVTTSLGGWSWNPGTATWVEPTCYALLFLKKTGHLVRGQRPIHVVDEAEAMVYDRMCRKGGWNYGNAQVLGEELRPYPLTTALALIALQENHGRLENQKSLDYLKQSVHSEKSVLSLSFAALCFDVYAQDWQHVWEKVEESYQETLFLQDIKTAALMLMVLDARNADNFFRLKPEQG